MQFIDSKSPTAIWASCAAAVLALAACSHDREPARTGGASASAVAAAQYSDNSDDASQSATRGDREATLQISNEVRARCSMPENSEAAPRFEYDQATLRARGENVLDAVARCLTDGPLKDETITLIGRTDPRGTEQYNDALAQSRAAAARNYLVARGVPSARIRLVSRGEQGARGTDEATWALDRRVDLELGNRSAPASTAARDSTASPIMKGTKLQIETSRSKREEHPNALSYSDTAEGGKPVSGDSQSSSSGSSSGDMSSSSSGEVKGSASGSVDVSAGTHH